jgi:hypothetical protein
MKAMLNFGYGKVTKQQQEDEKTAACRNRNGAQRREGLDGLELS